MTSPVSFSGGLSPLQRLLPAGTSSSAGSRTVEGLNFQEVLMKSIEQVNNLDRQSQSMIAGALTGENYTQAEVFTAVKKADLAFRTMLQIRNKLIDAYNELINIRM